MVGITDQLSGRQASRYVARMFSGQLDEREAQSIQQWRQTDPDHQQHFDDTVSVLADIEALARHPDIRAVIDHSARSRRAKKARRYGIGAALVAGFVLVAVFGLGVFFGERNVESIDNNVLRYVTRIGEQKTIELADGSVVTLNTGSEILVNINETKRRVSLERGEAFFTVVGDPSKPFQVNVGSRTVSVLGTEFNILKSPEKFTLAVVEGVVAIHQTEQEISPTAPVLNATHKEQLRLHSPGQQRVRAGTVVEYNIENNAITAWLDPDINRLQQWRKGLLQFEDDLFSNVVRELNRYSGKKILIEDAEVMNLKIYAAVRVDRIDTALADLEKTLPIKVINHFDRIVIERK